MYGIHDWVDADDFLKQLCLKTGKLLKGGEPDLNNISKQMIVDWQRGNIPYFVPPPKTEEEQEKEEQKMVELDPAKKNPIMEAAES